MNQRMLEELARQRLAEVRRITGGCEYRSAAADVPAGAALARTGPSRRRRRAGSSAYVSATSTRPARDRCQSLRARTGWRLVDLGLRLALQPDSRNAASPRPAGS
jgi:hypothetical protein